MTRDAEPHEKAVDLFAYFAALSEVSERFVASEALQLIRGAAEAGVLGAFSQATTVAMAAKDLNRDESHLTDLCAALRSHGVLMSDDGVHFTLHSAWAMLVRPGGHQPLEVLMELSGTRGRMLRSIARGEHSGWAGDTRERFNYAIAVSPDPWSPATVAAFSASMQTNPEVVALLNSGARYLELGCGVAGNMCTLLQAFPNVRAVGVEMASDLADEARRRAHALGIADRLDIVCADATTFSRPNSFDIVFWSQMFFPAASRRAALAVSLQSLRPGGLIWSPAFDQTAVHKEPLSKTACDLVLDRVIHGSWGVPHREPEELRAELEDAGFVGAYVLDRPGSKVVLGHRPVD